MLSAFHVADLRNSYLSQRATCWFFLGNGGVDEMYNGPYITQNTIAASTFLTLSYQPARPLQVSKSKCYMEPAGMTEFLMWLGGGSSSIVQSRTYGG